MSSLLSHAIESWSEGHKKINKDYLELFLNKKRPFQATPFDNVSQLRPASLYQIESGGVISSSSYLTSQDNSISVREAYRDCARGLSGKDVTVMFSGGLDSLSWYLALRSELGSQHVNLATVDWRPGSKDGPYFAQPVADRLNVDLDIISFNDGWTTHNNDVINHITSWMKKDITASRNPNHALVDYDNLNDVVINLTNNESILTLQMSHIYLRDMFNISNSLQKNVVNFGYFFFNHILNNIQYTSTYMRSHPYRVSFLASQFLIAKLINTVYDDGISYPPAKISVQDIDFSQQAILESIIAKTSPNIRPSDHKELFQSEIIRLSDHVTTDDTHYLARLIYYYSHMSWANNVLGKKLLTGQDIPTYLPTMWGPILQSSLFNDLTHKDAIRPRRELLELVKRETGYSFDQLRRIPTEKSENNSKTSISEYKKDVYSSIFVEHKALLSPDNSAILENINRSHQDWYEGELNSIRRSIPEGRGKFETVTKASRMINLELLLNHSASD
jgi:hypothetical protein